MGHTLRTRGIGPKEGLLALAVILIFAAIMYPLVSREQNKNLILSESARMRRLYVALAFYEQQYDNQPAPTLTAATNFDPNKLDYQSSKDPFRDVSSAEAGGKFPNDPGIANQEFASLRVSFSYIQNFIRNKKITVKPWEVIRMDPMVGEISNEWLGDVDAGKPFEAKVSGRVLRVGTDGAIYILKDRGGPKDLGDAQDLFIRR